jgi:hypothetical protein
MTTVADHNAEVVRKLTERNKVAEFAMQQLGLDERRADVFVKACGDFLKWDGTLQFKTASGSYVAADDPQCIGFFQREFDFLVPAKKVEGQQVGAVDPALIEKALAGNWTAKSQIFRQLHEGKAKGTEGETQAALDKLLADAAAKGNGGGERQRDDSGKFVANGGEKSDASNPFSRAGWNLTAQGRALRNDPARAARLAKAAGVTVGATRPAA